MPATGFQTSQQTTTAVTTNTEEPESEWGGAGEMGQERRKRDF